LIVGPVARSTAARRLRVAASRLQQRSFRRVVGTDNTRHHDGTWRATPGRVANTRSCLRPAALLVILTGALPAYAEGPATPAHIVGGQASLEGEDAAVVALVGDGTDSSELSGPYCTGTAVAADVIVTAAHCVVVGGEVVLPDIFTGLRFSEDATLHPAAWVAVYPFYQEGLLLGDIALVGLRDPLDVVPAPLRRESFDEDDVGRALRFVGYGVHEAPPQTPHGVKFWAEGRVMKFDEAKLLHDPVTCFGDSGGPAFDGEELVAVVSSGPAACVGYGRATRVDVFASWIDSWLDASPPGCEQDGRCAAGCDGGDPDCSCPADGVCEPCEQGRDPDCAEAAFGDPCVSSDECDYGVCNDGVCAPACYLGCYAGEACVEVGEGEVACLPTRGCSSSQSPGGAVWLVVVLLVGLTLRRQRHRLR
jgi:MYXO-CTERM domain-containing protein